MINAHIEMDLNQHISVVSANIIELIEDNEAVILEELIKIFLKRYESYTPDQFMDGLAFLFSIGCLNVENFRVTLRNV